MSGVFEGGAEAVSGEEGWWGRGGVADGVRRDLIYTGKGLKSEGSSFLTCKEKNDMAGIPVTIIGELYYSGLSVGGGPIIPQPPVGQPPGIWGPPGPWPTPPIALPPGVGSGNPPGIWGPPGPWPTPPINLPPGSNNPPGIWGPPGPWPTPPIALPPGVGSGNPPGIWGPPGPWPSPPIANVPGLPPSGNPPGWGLRPEHPIVPPGGYPDQPPIEPPIPPAGAGGNWQWGWNVQSGWHPVFVPGDKPQPIPPPSGGTPPPEGGTPPDTGNLPPSPTHPIEGVPQPQPIS